MATTGSPVSYDQAASVLVADNCPEQTIQHIMDVGGGTWDKESVTRALQAAYNDPQLAVDYLCAGIGIPETAEEAVPVARFPVNLAKSAVGSGPVSVIPNSSPLNLFPQETHSGVTSGGLGLRPLDFLRKNQQFQEMRRIVHAYPQMLQPLLQEIGKQNPQLLRLVQEHQAEFFQLKNEPVEASEGGTNTSASASVMATTGSPVSYDQAASVLVADNCPEQTIQHIMDVGGGTWDKKSVTRALQAAYNDPQLAVDYLCAGIGIPETAEEAVPVARFPVNLAKSAVGSGPVSVVPNSSPLNLFPQETHSGATGGGLGLRTLDFLRKNQQFQEMRRIVHAYPQMLQPLLQEIGKQNPQLLRLVQEHQAEFFQLKNEPVEASEGSRIVARKFCESQNKLSLG